MLVKICGITSARDAVLCSEAGADMLGFVFATSPRRVTETQAGDILEILPGKVLKVGVFLDQSLGRIAGMAVRLGLDYVQLHGDETPAFCRELHERTGIGIIKAISIREADDLTVHERYTLDCITFILLDSRVIGQRGGTGKPFPWDTVRTSPALGKRLFVAGGLTCSNVKEAVKRFAPAGVDVSSGVEKQNAPGVKDISKVRRFIREAKSCIA